MTDPDLDAQLQSIKDRIIILESNAATPPDRVSRIRKIVGAVVGSVASGLIVYLLILLAVVVTRWALR